MNGVVWYRKVIDLPASMAGKPAKVFLGRIVDADIFYINCNQVGQTTYQYPQRRYNVPADLLKAGINVFVIKITNFNGKGGAMVAPVINYSIKGILWYQGESNESHPKEYAELLQSLIRDWRNKFNNPYAPFICLGTCKNPG